MASIEIKPPTISTLLLPLVGDSPLIVHAWSEKARRQMADKQQKRAVRGREARDPWADFVGSLYWLNKPDVTDEAAVEAGRFGFPAIGFKAAAVTACTSTGITKIAARQAFHIDGEFVEIKAPPPSMREDVVRVGMGAADLRYRGEFWPWRVDLLVKFNADLLSAEQLANLFNLAGFAVGVAEWRPERDGVHGRFHVGSRQEVG